MGSTLGPENPENQFFACAAQPIGGNLLLAWNESCAMSLGMGWDRPRAILYSSLFPTGAKPHFWQGLRAAVAYRPKGRRRGACALEYLLGVGFQVQKPPRATAASLAGYGRFCPHRGQNAFLPAFTLNFSFRGRQL